MKMLRLFFSLMSYDLRIAYRHKSDWANAWLFFILIVLLFPLALSPEPKLLQLIAPGLIWTAALLAMTIALPNFLRPDYEDGSLVNLLLSTHSLNILVLAKIVAHWLITSLPLIAIAPLLALSLHLSGMQIVVMELSLLLGTPIFTLLGALTVALTLNLGGNGLLLNILLLPLCIPVLIFGSSAVSNVALGLPFQGPVALLGAILVFAAMVTPGLVGVALRSAEM